MAKLSRDELIEELKAYTGDRTDDETLKLIEDVSDSTESEDSEDWEGKYNDLAKKYKDRFSGSSEEVKEEVKDEPKEETEESDAEDIQIDDLFEDEKED